MGHLYGLIGYPLGHSFSASYFGEKFLREGIVARYENFPLARIEDFPALLMRAKELKGLNVTIPHKQAVLNYLDELDDIARSVGAVNTIRISDGRLSGFNTDVAGFRNSLRPLLRPWHTRALVLGTGGSSRAVLYVLNELGIDVVRVSRQPGPDVMTYEGLTPGTIGETFLIINTTPLGMHPDTGTCAPIPYGEIGPRHLLFDLVYNPAETRFLKQGRERGAATCNGYQMLVGQAEAAWQIWQGAGLP
ncbi:MAG: shikimate dehydrogenase [Bacteroidales bacterium]